jgi:hypothetical protein
MRLLPRLTVGIPWIRVLGRLRRMPLVRLRAPPGCGGAPLASMPRSIPCLRRLVFLSLSLSCGPVWGRGSSTCWFALLSAHAILLRAAPPPWQHPAEGLFFRLAHQALAAEAPPAAAPAATPKLRGTPKVRLSCARIQVKNVTVTIVAFGSFFPEEDVGAGSEKRTKQQVGAP